MLIEGEWSCFIKRIVKFKCCISSCLNSKSKRYRLLEKGRKDLAVETDIVNLLKQLRAIRTIVKLKLDFSKEEKEKVKKEKRRELILVSDSEVNQEDESDFIRKVTMRPYDSKKV